MGGMIAGKSKGRGRRSGGSYKPVAEINVTPMVDVMLVLLIVFMVSAPLLTAGVPVELPSSKAKAMQSEDNKPIEITLDTEGKIYLAETEVQVDALVSILQPMMEGDDERRIYIRADQGIEYGQVMNLLGLLNSAGFSKVALISKPKQ